ncbi:MAG: hypothetical protein AAFR98_07485 [Pseudomonadota bacterium]
MLHNLQEYYQFFADNLSELQPHGLDITPEYCLLTSGVWQTVKAEFEDRGINSKVIFIMREPTCRLESGMRMTLGGKRSKVDPSNVDPNEMLLAEMKTLTKQKLSAYEKTVSALRGAFPEKDIFFGFYETMFEPSEITRLSHFIDGDPVLFKPDEMVNSRPRPFSYSREVIDQAKAQYAPIWEFVSNEFGFDLSHWEKAIHELQA